MKRITKGSEPSSLTQYRSQSNASFGDVDTGVKNELRKSLLIEQGHICCYCMKRIPESTRNPSSKIEHFRCQSINPQEQLNYNNMFLACCGNQGSLKTSQTCDTSKENKSLNPLLSPLDDNIENRIKYKANGEIFTEDTNLNNELNFILNLNEFQLKENRKVVFRTIRDKIRNKMKKQRDNSLKRNFLNSEKTKWITPQNGKYREFCMVAIYVINKKLNRLD